MQIQIAMKEQDMDKPAKDAPPSVHPHFNPEEMKMCINDRQQIQLIHRCQIYAALPYSLMTTLNRKNLIAFVQIFMVIISLCAPNNLNALDCFRKSCISEHTFCTKTNFVKFIVHDQNVSYPLQIHL